MTAEPGEAPLEVLDKGAPGDGAPTPLGEVGARGWNLLREDLPLPVAVLKDTALRNNSTWMRRFLEHTGAKIAPHGKTTMAPALFDLQIEAGAWAITVSTPHQIRVARQFGHSRLFIANQLVGRAAIEYVFRELQEHHEVELYCLADSVANIQQLNAVAARLNAQRPLNVLVEVGFAGGRTGCRTSTEALAVARAVRESRYLTLAGVEAFEGIMPGPTLEARESAVRAFLSQVGRVAEACAAERLFETDVAILTAGGTAYFDLVVESFEAIRLDRPKSLVIRSGCYLTHDSVMYTRAFAALRERMPNLTAQLGEMSAALEVWGYVQSRPEASRVIAGIGKRDISYDDMPVALLWYRPDSGLRRPTPMPDGHTVLRLNDQHCYLDVPVDSPLQVGDMIGFGVSHPCLTFDKWRVLHRVDDDYHIIGSLRTYF